MGGTATLGWLATIDARVHISCGRRVYVAGDAPGELFELHTLRHAYGLTLSAAEAAERWGDAATLDQVERRARCRLCGAKGPPDVRVQTSSPLSPEVVRRATGP